MRFTTVLAMGALLVGCVPRPPPPDPTPVPVDQPAPAELALAAEPEPEPDVPEPAPPLANASFHATVTRADGKVTVGRVVRVERGVDWFAEDGWTTRDVDRSVTLAGDGTEVEARWEEIARIDIRYGGKGDVDCTYDSSYTPHMYACVMKTTGAAKTTDGKSWEPASRHRWRFTFADGAVEEFHLHKLPARAQEAEKSDEENYALYTDLHRQVTEDAKRAVTRIEIAP